MISYQIRPGKQEAICKENSFPESSSTFSPTLHHLSTILHFENSLETIRQFSLGTHFYFDKISLRFHFFSPVFNHLAENIFRKLITLVSSMEKANVENRRRTQFDRRKGPDVWKKSISWFAVGGWLTMFTALVFFGIAKPHTVTIFKQSLNLKMGRFLVNNLSILLFYFMISGLLLSIGGFYINLKRNRRRDDEYHLSLLILGMISILGIISYLVAY